MSEKIKKQQQSENPTSWKNRDHLYIHYLYKITNKINGRYYIGIHSVLKSKRKTPENDNYYGSGTEITKAIKKEGKKNFIKEILKIFSTRAEAREAEKEMVTIDVVKDPMSYNKTIGGGANNCGRVIVNLKGYNKLISIDLEEFYKNRDLYEINNDIVTVKLKSDPEGKYFTISKEEYRLNKDLYLTPSSGKVSVETLDEDGNRTGIYIKISKEEYDEYKGIKYSPISNGMHGKVLCRNLNNTDDKVYLSKDDPKYLSGEYVPITKGKHLTKEQRLNISGDKNGRFETHWITNGHENKIIKNGENIPNGWRVGRITGQSVNYGKKRYKNIDTGEEFYYSDEEFDKINNSKLKPPFLFDKNNKFISKNYLIEILDKLGISIDNNELYFSYIKSIIHYMNLYRETVVKILEYYGIKIIHKQCTNKELERYCLCCGERIISKYRNVNFCSIECYNKYRRLYGNTNIPSKKELISKFKELKSSKEVSNYYSVATTTVNNWIRKLGIRDEIDEIIKSTKKYK